MRWFAQVPLHRHILVLKFDLLAVKVRHDALNKGRPHFNTHQVHSTPIEVYGPRRASRTILDEIEFRNQARFHKLFDQCRYGGSA